MSSEHRREHVVYRVALECLVLWRLVMSEHAVEHFRLEGKEYGLIPMPQDQPPLAVQPTLADGEGKKGGVWACTGSFRLPSLKMRRYPARRIMWERNG